MIGFFSRFSEAYAATKGTDWKSVQSRFSRKSWVLKIKDYGPVDLHVRLGDADGSGEAPCVHIEFEHEFSDGPKAIALSGREVDALRNVLGQASERIKPHERVKARYRHIIEKGK